MIVVDIDTLTPCLIEVKTGKIVETEVIRISNKGLLKGYNKKTGWYTSWSSLVKNHEVYALVIKGTKEIQGLVAFHYDLKSRIAFLDWAVAAPHNNPLTALEKKYEGVGGHLIAIAVQRSEEVGLEGEVTGFAANAKLENHYIEKYGAIPIHLLHYYHIMFPSKAGKKIKEVYTYAWNNDERRV